MVVVVRAVLKLVGEDGWCVECWSIPQIRLERGSVVIERTPRCQDADQV